MAISPAETASRNPVELIGRLREAIMQLDSMGIGIQSRVHPDFNEFVVEEFSSYNRVESRPWPWTDRDAMALRKHVAEILPKFRRLAGEATETCQALCEAIRGAFGEEWRNAAVRDDLLTFHDGLERIKDGWLLNALRVMESWGRGEKLPRGHFWEPISSRMPRLNNLSAHVLRFAPANMGEAAKLGYASRIAASGATVEKMPLANDAGLLHGKEARLKALPQEYYRWTKENPGWREGGLVEHLMKVTDKSERTVKGDLSALRKLNGADPSEGIEQARKPPKRATNSEHALDSEKNDKLYMRPPIQGKQPR